MAADPWRLALRCFGVLAVRWNLDFAGVFVKRVALCPPAGREPPPVAADPRRLALRCFGVFVCGRFFKRFELR